LAELAMYAPDAVNKNESIGHDAAAAASLTGHVGTALYVSPEMLKSDSRYNQVCCYFSLSTHTHPFNGPFSGTTRESRYQKGKTNLDFTEARDSEWQWHQLGHVQVCTLLQTDNHTSTPPLCFLQAGCPSCHPTNSIKALKALLLP